MASKRDLVEAHAYNRRRLVSAFLSGAPGGREVESVSRSRPVVASLALGGLLVGGAAIAGLFATPLPNGWENGYVVLGKSSAARFVSIKGTLHPVLNATSARLILPSDKGFQVLVVDDERSLRPPTVPRWASSAPPTTCRRPTLFSSRGGSPASTAPRPASRSRARTPPRMPTPAASPPGSPARTRRSATCSPPVGATSSTGRPTTRSSSTSGSSTTPRRSPAPG